MIAMRTGGIYRVFDSDTSDDISKGNVRPHVERVVPHPNHFATALSDQSLESMKS